ncbi:14092_t:CDS:2 [Ambispora leptoticha]|uniref:14092_t:CDS:1 n=1 Tax=Ambispora leptoticha TaxID=144679 RepID=A0A9N9FLK2_9GLOM|nr:14092_t:CDS:2 [Ambispora leptoticha]
MTKRKTGDRVKYEKDGTKYDGIIKHVFDYDPKDKRGQKYSVTDPNADTIIVYEDEIKQE